MRICILLLTILLGLNDGAWADQSITKPQTHISAAEGQVGLIVEGCVLSIATDKEKYSAGDLITLTANVKNTGKHIVYMPIGPALLSYQVQVLSKNGKAASKTLFYKQLSSRSVLSNRILPLNPGDQVTEFINLGRAFDLSVEGDYTITAHRVIGKNGGSAEITMLPSNTVKFRIVEDDYKFYNPVVEKK